MQTPHGVVIPADKSEVVVTLASDGAADVGTWPLLAAVRVARAGRGERDPLLVGMNGLGTAAQAGGRRPRRGATDALPQVSSDLTKVFIAESPKGSFLSASGEQGKAMTVKCQFASPLSLPGDFTATLGGLPPRAVARPVPVKPGMKEVTFEVTLDPTTPQGSYPSLVCELNGVVRGQAVVLRSGRGGVLKVELRGGLKTDATGKPLSPLDALRKEMAEKKKP